jgi:hypothetical protein
MKASPSLFAFPHCHKKKIARIHPHAAWRAKKWVTFNIRELCVQNQVFSMRESTTRADFFPGPELKEPCTRKACPHRLISLKNHTTAIFGMGNNFFL